MRVYVIEGSGKGGMIHYDYHLCRALQRLGIETTLVTSTAYELRDLAHNFRVVELLHLWDPRGGKARDPLRRLIQRAWRGVQYVREWLRLIAFLRKERPDVILFGEIRFGFEYYFLYALRALGLNLADIVHDVRTYDTRRDSTELLQESRRQLSQYNRIYALFSALFVHDKSNRDLFLSLHSVPAERVHAIPMATNELVLELPPDCTPLELRAELNIAPTQHVVLFFGTLSKYKGVENLIRAFPTVHRATGARLVIAGFPAKDIDPLALKTLAAQLGVENQISWFLDYVPNRRVVPLMTLSDVVVFPYRMVTQSAAVQVAYACGKPVVATRIGGLPDIVEEGKSGLLVPPDDPASLADAITQIVNDPVTAQHMGQYARTLSQTRYSWQIVADRMKAVFEGLQ